jgi:hypothetical protein
VVIVPFHIGEPARGHNPRHLPSERSPVARPSAPASG